MISIFALNSVFAAENSTDFNTESLNDDSINDVHVDESALKNSNDDNEIQAQEDNNNYKYNSVDTIKMGNVIKRYNGAIQYYAYFYNSTGSPLIKQSVYYQVDGNNMYLATTDSNGMALLTVQIKNGKHVITALNTATLKYKNDTINVFNVINGGKNLKVFYDNGNYYKVRVFGDDGKPVKAGQKVTFNLNGKNHNAKTDKNGYAKLKITMAPGTYIIFAKYKNFVTKYNTIQVKNVLKSLTSFSRKSTKQSIKYKVKLLGKNYKNKKITVKFNKKTYKAKTNKKGIATFKLKTPKKLGNYYVITSYKKNKIIALYSKYRT